MEAPPQEQPPLNPMQGTEDDGKAAGSGEGNINNMSKLIKTVIYFCILMDIPSAQCMLHLVEGNTEL